MLGFITTVAALATAGPPGGELYDAVAPAAHRPPLAQGPRHRSPHQRRPHTLFVQFDGVTLEQDPFTDDARNNKTMLPELAKTYAPFGAAPGEPIRAAIVEAVRGYFAGYRLDVTDTRPESGDYSMIVVSPSGGSASNLGRANLHCGGSLRGIGAAWYGAAGAEAAKVASTVAHEAGHTFGLEHVGNGSAVMAPTYSPSQLMFSGTCDPITPEGGARCGAEHAKHCDGGTQQNANAELLRLFGSDAPDGGAPVVDWVSPAHGQRFEIGASVRLEAEASDDVGIDRVEFWQNGELQSHATEAPYARALKDLQEGAHELRTVAYDLSGLSAERTIWIAVGDAEVPAEPPDDGGTGTGGSTEVNPEGRRDGCGCRGAQTSAGAWVCLLLAGMRRRWPRRPCE